VTVVTKLMEGGLDVTGPRGPLRFIRPRELFRLAGKDRRSVGLFLDQIRKEVSRALPL
jgi:hypothetical protein